MDYVPYCGSPPVPQDLLASWNFDPALLIALIGSSVVGAFLICRIPTPVRATRLAAFASVELLGVIVFVSPLCSLAMALFSARLAQHLLLTVVAAPLLVWALVEPLVPRKVSVKPWLAAAGFFVVFWFWHLPQGYALTLTADSAYWAMHISTFLGASLLWLSIIRSSEQIDPGAALAAFITAAQLSLLSALMLLSRSHWHSWHTGTTQPFGLTPMEDQVLGAAIMWTGGGLIFLGICIALTGRLVAKTAD